MQHGGSAVGLPTGQRLGPYEIVAPLGAGGMGQVYRARDTRLERSVAIKVLPPGLADEPERRERFEREARAVSSLNHPHICTLFDVGQQNSLVYLVMECLDGETLGRRLTRGALPLDQVLRYAVEMAEALDHAHRHGVVHRDLKPNNVMLTKAGAKLLDFGLAKLQNAGFNGAGESMASTEPRDLTDEAVILGTLQYMAPEQLAGKEADARTDLFAFGAVVYEMAIGRKAFEGSSHASVIAAIISSQPAPLLTEPPAPPGLARALQKCLAKDPDDRWQTARDLADELKWIAEAQPAQITKPRSKAVRTAAWALGLGILASLGVWGLLRGRPAPPPSVTRFHIATPPDAFWSLSLSPDGRPLVYGAAQGQLYLREMEKLESKPIAGAERSWCAFFSPDGEWVAFAGGRALSRISLSGGGPQTICAARNLHGGAWGPDDTIVFTPESTTGLWRVPAAGGTPEPLTTPDRARGEKSHRYPEFLPGGKAVLFTVVSADIASADDARVEAVELQTGERHLLLQGGYAAQYAPTGHLVYARRGSLLAVPFDLGRLKVTGAPVPLVEGVDTLVTAQPPYRISPSGSLVYIPGTPQFSKRRLVWVDRHGKTLPASEIERSYIRVALSPDGRRLAVAIYRINDQVAILDFERGTLTSLTFEWDSDFPVWTPDGSRVTFTSTHSAEPWSLFSVPSDGSGRPEPLVHTERASPRSWSPDGRHLAFVISPPHDIWILTREGGSAPRPLLATPFREDFPRFSPDGRWLAYVSDESGRDEVYVRPFPGPGGKWQVSTEGGTEPLWARNGRELFYRSARGAGSRGVMAVRVQSGPSFVASKSEFLFEDRYVGGTYDVAPDGQQFVMIEDLTRERSPRQLTVVLNWLEGLKRPGPGT